MSGVVFIVTIPTERHEWQQEQEVQANINEKSNEPEINLMSKVKSFP